MMSAPVVPERRTEEILVNLDSADRFEGTSNKFKVDVDRISNIVSMRVMAVEAPNTNYDIGPTVNRFSLYDGGGGEQVYILPDGRYTGMSLASTLTQLITAATGIAVAYDDKSNGLVFTAADPSNTSVYTMRFDTDQDPTNIWRVIGAPSYDVTLQFDAVNTSVWRSGPLRLRGEHPYILLSVDHMSVVHGNHGVGEPVAAKVTSENMANSSQYNVVQSAARRWPHNHPLHPINSFNVAVFNRDGSAYQLDTYQLSLTLFVVRLV
jgi:hypothetical protein